MLNTNYTGTSSHQMHGKSQRFQSWDVYAMARSLTWQMLICFLKSDENFIASPSYYADELEMSS